MDEDRRDSWRSRLRAHLDAEIAAGATLYTRRADGTYVARRIEGGGDDEDDGHVVDRIVDRAVVPGTRGTVAADGSGDATGRLAAPALSTGPTALDRALRPTLHPVRIPPTAPDCYVSFYRALNLRLPGETTGDWHERIAWWSSDAVPPTVELAGRGCRVDTMPALGTRGVRDMAGVLRAMG